ncbi:hypothetical protein [Catenibacterium mitsuokai]|uniref:hypothetical protein n=1 Tax=Catenibacterium mitsuokai TaxID=100886 RepID=UPI00319E2888
MKTTQQHILQFKQIRLLLFLCVSQRTYTDGHLLPEVQHNNMCTNDLSHLVNASLYVSTR